MPRGYRLALCAAFGWLALCSAQPPHQETYGSKSAKNPAPAPTETIAPTPAPAASPSSKFTAYPGYNPDRCYRAKDHDAADLCAQWRAAIATEKAAHEARRATTWSIVATILSFLGISGLGYTIFQTHGALAEARRGNILAMRENARASRRAAASAKETTEALQAAKQSASAANRHAEVAEQSARAQLAAYLIADRVTVHGRPGKDSIWVEVFIKNAGVTPARITKVGAMVWICAHTVNPHRDCPPIKDYYHLRDWFPQGVEDRILVGVTSAVVEPAIAKINDTDMFDAHVYGRIDYTDVFGQARWMTFAFRPKAWGVEQDSEFVPCVDGNDGN